MRLTIRCTGCGQNMRFGAGQAQRVLNCPNCQTLVRASTPTSNTVTAHASAAFNRPLFRLRILLAVGLVLVLGLIGFVWARRLPEPSSPPRSQPYDSSTFAAVPALGLPQQLLLDPRSDATGKRTVPLEPLTVPPATVLSLNTSDVKGLALQGQIPQHLALAYDATNELFLAATTDARILLIDARQCRLVGVCQLERSAYHLVLHPKRKLLYAALANRPNLAMNVLGDLEHAAGDLAVFDLSTVLSHRGEVPVDSNKAAFVHPQQRLSIDARVRQLFLSNSGEHLYYLAESPQNSKVACIDVETFSEKHELTLRQGGILAIAAAPDMDILHVLAGTRLVSLDPQTWQPIAEPILVGGALLAIVAGTNNRVYMLERRNTCSHVYVVDTMARRTLARWQFDVEGRPYLGMSQERLILSTSAVTGGRVVLLGVGESYWQQNHLPPEVRAVAHSTIRHVLRGALFISSDGRYIVTGSGVVLKAS